MQCPGLFPGRNYGNFFSFGKALYALVCCPIYLPLFILVLLWFLVLMGINVRHAFMHFKLGKTLNTVRILCLWLRTSSFFKFNYRLVF